MAQSGQDQEDFAKGIFWNKNDLFPNPPKVWKIQYIYFRTLLGSSKRLKDAK